MSSITPIGNKVSTRIKSSYHRQATKLAVETMVEQLHT